MANQVDIERKDGWIVAIEVLSDRGNVAGELIGVLATPEAARVDTLTVHPQHDAAAVVAALTARPLPVRTLRLLLWTPGSRLVVPPDLGPLDPIYAAFRDLEALEVSCGRCEVGAPDLPHLKRLSVAAASPSPRIVADLHRAALPALDQLTLALAVDPRAEAALRAAFPGARIEVEGPRGSRREGRPPRAS